MASDWPLVGRAHELDRIRGALASGAQAGVVLIGPGGVGKTRLAAECLRIGEEAGFATARVAATRSSAEITLGALAPLLPDFGDRSVNLLGAARDALAARAGSKRLLLFVDDAHLLDEASATLLLQIVAERQVFVVITVRAGEEVGDAITALWKEGHAERIDVGPLPELDIDTLIVDGLQGVVDPHARGELRRVSHGNPLALRELVLGATEVGALAIKGGVWRLNGSITVTPRLIDLVADRLEILEPPEYEALEVLALGEPVEVGVLESLTDPVSVEALERKGFLVVREDDDRLEAWLAHPLHGEIVRDRIGVLRTRSVLRHLADALERAGTGRGGDLLRLATWRLESGTATDPEVLVGAARQAVVALDYRAATRLSRAAWEQAPGFEGGLLLGHVLCELGEFENAEPVLAAVEDLAESDEERVLAAMARSENLFRMDQPDPALEVVVAAEARITDPAWRLELIGHRATFVMLLGHPGEALELARPAAEGEMVRPRIEASIATATVLMWDGCPEAGLEVAERAYREHLEIWEQQLFQSDPGIHVVGIVSALTLAGRLDEAEGVLDLAWTAVTETNAVQGLAWFAMLYGRLALTRGRMVKAAAWFRQSAGYFAAAVLPARERWALGGLVQAAVHLGQQEEAEAALAALEGMSTCVRFNEVGVDEARAWALVGRGELVAARALLDDAANAGIAGGSRTCAALALHSLARIGAPERAVDRLEELSCQSEGRLMALRATHTRALVDVDGRALDGVSGEFEAMGAVLLAAEAAADAARAWRAADHAREAAAAVNRSRTLASACEGVWTPALAVVDEPAPLTRREREVALLAAQGLASKAIGEQLFLSVRTVDNHLQRAYEKLGVRGRDELSAVLGTAR